MKNQLKLTIIISSLILSYSCTKDSNKTTKTQQSGQSIYSAILDKINVEVDSQKISTYYGGKSKTHKHKNTKVLCLADEQQFEFIQRDVIYGIEDVFRNNNMAKFDNIFSTEGTSYLYHFM